MKLSETNQFSVLFYFACVTGFRDDPNLTPRLCEYTFSHQTLPLSFGNQSDTDQQQFSLFKNEHFAFLQNIGLGSAPMMILLRLSQQLSQTCDWIPQRLQCYQAAACWPSQEVAL